jgi:hypothetical protein
MQPEIPRYTFQSRFIGLLFHVDEEMVHLLLHRAPAKEDKKNKVIAPETWMPLAARPSVGAAPFGEIVRCAHKKYQFSRRILAEKPEVLSGKLPGLSDSIETRHDWLAVEVTHKFDWTEAEKRLARDGKSQTYWTDIRWFTADSIGDALDPMAPEWRKRMQRALAIAAEREPLFADLYQAFRNAC